MKVTFISNYLNHHQLPLAKALLDIPEIDYTFVATTPFNTERAAMGYKDINKEFDFVIRAYENHGIEKKAHELALESDIVIVGSAPDSYMSERLRKGKTTFHSSERYYKNDVNIKTFPRFLASSMKHLWPYQNKPLYFLCSSAYTAWDVNRFSNFKNRCYKWGYFTEVKEIEPNKIHNHRSHVKPVILWAGRFISWKHPEDAIRVARYLQHFGYDYELRLIGGGELEGQLRSMVDEYNLWENVTFLGFQPPEKVRKNMEEADIFLFTSDFAEGWGAVLNESMSSGCAVVASHAIGAAPYLIQDGINGFLYKFGNENQLFARVKTLMDHPEIRARMGSKAYEDISRFWSPEIAAKRLIQLASSIDKGQLHHFENGPCSKAEILKNGWYSDD